MKFDITKRLPGVDELLAKTENPRHLAILKNYYKHATLEVCGLWPEILSPAMTVPNPIYRFHGPKGSKVLEGMDAVRSEYELYVRQNSTVMYHLDESIAVSDSGFLTEYVVERFYPGWVLREQGEDIDDPNATYLSRLTQMMYWPYNEKVQLMEERVYRGNDRTIRKCVPEEVITVDECREKLLPLLKNL